MTMAKRKPLTAGIDAPKNPKDNKTKPEKVSQVKSYQAPSRVGTVAITSHVTPEARRNLKVLSLEVDKSQTLLFQEALNLLFKEYNKPQMDLG